MVPHPDRCDHANGALKRIAFVHPFLLHYHYPRLSALAAACERMGIIVENIQLAGYTETYRSLIQDRDAHFRNRCLFAGQKYSDIPAHTMRACLKQALEHMQPQAIFLYGYSFSIMRWARSWAQSEGIGSILISDSNYLDKRRNPVFEFLKSMLVSRFDAAFVGGESSTLYLEHLGFPRARIAVGYDVVDNENIRSRNSSNKPNIEAIRASRNLPEQYFLFVGRMVECKNVLGLIRSFADYVRALGSDPWDLVLCGDGPDEATFRRLAEASGEKIAKHIRFLGLVRQPEIIDVFSGANCLVLPSTRYESWGLVINEALACELPVIVSQRCGCAMDLVKNDLNGWQFDPDDPRALTERLIQMHCLAPRARAEMGRHGQGIILNWGLDRFVSGAMESAQIAIRHAGRN